MEWITTKHIISTDGKTEKIWCKLYLNFPVIGWNKKDKSPVIELFYYDYKVESGWWIDDNKTKWYTHPPHKHFEVSFNYFQRMPNEKIFSNSKRVGYEDFTLDYCKQEAVRLFKQHLENILFQL